MDFALTDEQQLVRETARAFSTKEIVPRAKENARSAHLDTDRKLIVGRAPTGIDALVAS